MKCKQLANVTGFFLGNFAMKEGLKGGVFFMSISITCPQH